MLISIFLFFVTFLVSSMGHPWGTIKVTDNCDVTPFVFTSWISHKMEYCRKLDPPRSDSYRLNAARDSLVREVFNTTNCTGTPMEQYIARIDSCSTFGNLQGYIQYYDDDVNLYEALPVSRGIWQTFHEQPDCHYDSFYAASISFPGTCTFDSPDPQQLQCIRNDAGNDTVVKNECGASESCSVNNQCSVRVSSAEVLPRIGSCVLTPHIYPCAGCAPVYSSSVKGQLVQCRSATLSPTSSPTTAAPTSSTAASPAAPVVGGVVGALAAIALIGAIIFVSLRIRKRKFQDASTQNAGDLQL